MMPIGCSSYDVFILNSYTMRHTDGKQLNEGDGKQLNEGDGKQLNEGEVLRTVSART